MFYWLHSYIHTLSVARSLALVCIFWISSLMLCLPLYVMFCCFQPMVKIFILLAPFVLSSLNLCFSDEQPHLSIHAPSVRISHNLIGSLKDLTSLQKKLFTRVFWPLSGTKTHLLKGWKMKCSTQALIYTHPAFVLPSAHCSQTNPSSFMSL